MDYDFDQLPSVSKQAYHRQKTAESRDEWKRLGVKQVSVYMSKNAERRVKSFASMVLAVELWEQVLANDPATIEILGNRRPKYSVTLEDVDNLMASCEADDHNQSIGARMNLILRQCRKEKMWGEEATNGADSVLYHLSREYVLCLYVKALYEMVLFNLSTGEKQVPVPLDHTAGEIPVVL